MSINCRLCSKNISAPIFSNIIFGKSVFYFDCNVCGYVQTEYPTWLGETYSEMMTDSDTGVMLRNLSNVSLTLATLTLINKRNLPVVDYGAGYGVLVRLLRDIGINASWLDPYSKNLVAKGFEYSNTGKKRKKVALVTSFETFEHFINPLKEMNKIILISSNILLTTELVSDPVPKDWWYYALDSGQHIGFYRLKTLQYIAKKFNLNLLSDGVSIHFFSKKKYSYFLWKLFKILASRFPKFFKIGLNSYTWSDHQKISKN